MATGNQDGTELDELGDIENGGASQAGLVLSNVYNIKIGGFGGPDSIKTYLCTVKVGDLEQDISFYETLTRDKSWPVSQIIQREVDRIRVSNISKDYILGQGRSIKYFPPLIIAILPKAPDGKIDLNLVFTPDDSSSIKESIYDKSIYRANDKIKKYFLAAVNQSIVGGLYVLEVSKIFDFNLFCWDKEKHYAIIIDGQHRLASLIKSKRDNAAISNYTQDVVFMDFSFLIQKSAQRFTPVEVVRRIFIDINTNAKKVGAVRQILMDDKNLSSLLVQSLVDAVRKDGSEKNKDQFIISQVVDWYGESLKHALPHLTGILSLHQIMNDYLIQGDLHSIDDLRMPSKVTNWVARLNDIFLVDAKIGSQTRYEGVTPLRTSLQKFYESIEENDSYSNVTDNERKETEIFSFDYNILDVAQDTFSEKFARPIVRVFNNLWPYSETIRLLEEYGGFDSENLVNKALISSRKTIANDQSLRDKIAEVRRLLEGQLYSKYYHIFTVLGQKVVFSLFFQQILAAYNSTSSESDILIITDGFINEMNRMFKILSLPNVKLLDKKENVIIDVDNVDDYLVDLGAITSSFWDGIIYEDNKIIYNTQGIRSFSSLIHYILARIDELVNGRNAERPFIVSYLNARIKRHLKKKNTNLEDPQIEEYTEQIINLKYEFLEAYLVDAVEKWRQLQKA